MQSGVIQWQNTITFDTMCGKLHVQNCLGTIKQNTRKNTSRISSTARFIAWTIDGDIWWLLD